MTVSKREFKKMVAASWEENRAIPPLPQYLTTVARPLKQGGDGPVRALLAALVLGMILLLPMAQRISYLSPLHNSIEGEQVKEKILEMGRLLASK